MADVFISYSSSDRQLAKTLADAITGLGLSVWWDHEIVGGARFRREIHRELVAARAVIVVWTPNSVASDWVVEEAEEALHASKLVPVRLASLEVRELPLGGFRSLQTLVLGDREGLRRALQTQTTSQGKVDTVDRSLLRSDRFSFFAGGRLGNASNGIRDASHRCEAVPPIMAGDVGTLPRDQQRWATQYQGSRLLAAVVDGRAFGELGEPIARSAVHQIAWRFQNEDFVLEPSTSQKLLDAAITRCGSDIRHVVSTDPRLSNRCCPALAVALDGFGMHWVSAGDCALLLYRDRRLHRLNDNHSMGAWLDRQAEAGQISWAEARSARNRQAQRSGITGGDIPIIDRPSEAFPIQAGDWILLATQGLESLPGDEIATCMQRSVAETPERVVTALLDAVEGKKLAEQSNTAIIAIRASS